MNYQLPVPLDVRLMNWTASVLFVCCALLALAAAGRWVLELPIFSIQRIVVQGDVAHNSAMGLRAVVMPSLSGNFFTVDLDAARHAFEQAPWVRQAQVRREFPGSLRVVLREHDAVAFWGANDTTAQLLNSDGEVFDAEVDEDEQEELPRLQGPQGHSRQVLDMYRQLDPLMAALGLRVQALRLSGRGGWHMVLDNGAAVELGSGPTPEVLERTQRFARTLGEVVAQFQRKPEMLAYADLRHSSGYALRLRGVSTVSAEQAARLAAKRR